MKKINEGILVTSEGQHRLARRNNLVNTSVLQAMSQRFVISDFFRLNDTQPSLHQLAAAMGKQFPAKWLALENVTSQPDDFWRELIAMGMVELVKGDTGRPAKLAELGGIRGEIDYGPGLWIREELVLPWSRWRDSRQHLQRKSPLTIFLEKHLSPSTLAKPAAQHEVAISFADEVSAAELKVLRKIDQVMMGDGVSAAERREVLSARITVMQGA
ncbi:hypothetical protein [Pseudomonas cichorii]|uniref:Uncharacterized protein n=1 Tax=Pseudomonas cichorii TaxID=36746 RepID=A0ABQ1DT15_PSECI|nr:hypothetical protein [Pseudomonas cichorii]AHF66021.1 hypothetical protein PCH70_08680 [Pseudomonas cichorii JBC1]MBX8516074.1 hypothetical protein [Pseudomonas cichorii]QVE17986.1 hypothetical protein KGD89_04300 [Pseudomonas cichorii]SDP00106.1 hypothetical protein SAMN05216599_116122 [Pseudomonas cichorii]GFM94160.1 hypothetical protein PSCICP_41320 [Pseudomonas cichorii]